MINETYEATEIVKYLYLGSYFNVYHKFPEKNNIGLIIDVSCEKDTDTNIQKINYKLYDNHEQNISNIIDVIIDTIQINIDNKINVLIHCYAGKSRSASFVIAYLMKYKNVSMNDAYEFILSKRYIYPNDNFISQLMNYECELFKIDKSTFNIDDYMIQRISELFGCTIEKSKDLYHLNNKDIAKIIKSNLV
jgi:protein-tyrosine phosphatase